MIKEPPRTEAYERGFNDGLRWVAECLRLAANKVEAPSYGDFPKATNGGEAKTFHAIAKTGQAHFASQLRAVANEIESAIKTAKEDHSHGTQT